MRAQSGPRGATAAPGPVLPHTCLSSWLFVSQVALHYMNAQAILCCQCLCQACVDGEATKKGHAAVSNPNCVSGLNTALELYLSVSAL